MTVEDIARPRATPADRAQPSQEAQARPAAAGLAAVWVTTLLALLVFAASIAPRAAWVAYNDRAPQGLNDPLMYNLLADIMADGDGYSRPTGEPFAYYPVGYPATVAGLKKAHDLVGADRDIFSIKMMNGMFGAITSVMVFLLALRLFDRRTALGAGLLHAVFPSQVFYTGTVLSEPLFTMLLMGAVLILAWNRWDRDGMPWPQLAAAGLVLSAATMTRGITLLLPFVLLVVWLFYLRSRKRALLQAAVLFAGIAVFIVPWTVRNSVQFGTLVGPSTNLGDDLCIGNFDGADGRFTLVGKCFAVTEDPSAVSKSPDELEVERNREGLRIAVEDVASDPFRMPGLIAKKAYWLLYKDDDGLWAAESYGNDWFISHPRREILSFAANSIYYATGALALAGLAAFALARDVRRLFVVLAMLYVLAVPLAFFGDPRFHYPAIPLAIVIAAATAAWLSRRRGEGDAGEAA